MATGASLLDVACGTGRHLAHLQPHFTVEGLDLEPNLLDVARNRLPDVSLHKGDMRTFDLGRQFDIVTCLFSAIGYAPDPDTLAEIARNFARHTRPGGLVMVEPWLSPEAFRDGHLSAQFIDDPELKLARMTQSVVNGRVSSFDFHHLIATSDGVKHIVEHHDLFLFTEAEYTDAFSDAGYDATFLPYGLTGRGLILGVRKK
jgi:SAM-dependent methyltransferase